MRINSLCRRNKLGPITPRLELVYLHQPGVSNGFILGLFAAIATLTASCLHLYWQVQSAKDNSMTLEMSGQKPVSIFPMQKNTYRIPSNIVNTQQSMTPVSADSKPHKNSLFASMPTAMAMSAMRPHTADQHAAQTQLVKTGNNPGDTIQHMSQTESNQTVDGRWQLKWHTRAQTTSATALNRQQNKPDARALTTDDVIDTSLQPLVAVDAEVNDSAWFTEVTR